MPRTFISQKHQILSTENFNDALTTGISLQTSSVNLEEDLNCIRTQLRQVLWGSVSGSWYDEVASPTGSVPARGLNTITQDLALLETSSISTGSHNTLNQLIHLAISDGPFYGYGTVVKEIGPQPFPTASIWWSSIAKTRRIVDLEITRNSQQLPVTEIWRAYDNDGNVVETVTDTITLSGPFEIQRTRTSS
jgi:hypothetical protein